MDFRTRTRQSGPQPTPVPRASAIPGSSTSRAAIEEPPYEPAQFPLNPVGQRALATLTRSHDVQKLYKRFDDAQSQLTVAAMELNDKLREKRTRIENAQAKHRRPARQQDEDGDGGDEVEEEDTSLEERKRKLVEMQDKVNDMTTRMEEQFRKLVDGKHNTQWMRKSVENAAEDARNRASTQVSTQNMLLRRQRGTREDRESEDGENDDSEEDDEGIEDFQPTDPAAGTQPEQAPVNVFRTGLENEKTRYQSSSHYHRYAMDNDYKNFKRTIHDAIYAQDEVSLPPPEKWFEDDGTVAAPGQTRRRVGGDNEEDSDDDLVIERANISTKCPLTLQEFKDPVSSTKCAHSFERSAWTDFTRDQREVQCPVGGCTQKLRRSDVQTDPVLVRKIKRLQQAREMQDDDDDDDDGEKDGTQQRRAHVIDDDDGSDMDDGPTLLTQMKDELSQGNEPPGSTQVFDLGDSDEDMTQ